MNVIDCKRKLKNSKWFNWILELRDYFREKRLFKLRSKYFNDLNQIISPNTSVISSNCFAGRIMQDLGMQYNSPTLGLFFWSSDYLEFLSNLKFYLTEAKLEFVEHSKYAIGDERRFRWSHWYPIALLGGKVEINFLHYHSEEEAAEKWYRRSSRVNFDNLFVIGMEQNLCTIKDIETFDKLPFEKKIFFSTKELPNVYSNVCVDDFVSNGEVGDPYKKGHIFYRELIKKFVK